MRLGARKHKLANCDIAVWQAASVVQSLEAGHLPQLSIDAPFPLQDGEVMYGCGPMVMWDVMAYGTPVPPLLKPGQDAQGHRTFRWAAGDGGLLWVSNMGFRLETRTGLHWWGWTDVQGADLYGPGQVMILGLSADGPVRWLLGSDWSELLFALWARRVNPRHRAYVQRSWIPPGWVDRVRRSGVPFPSAQSVKEPS